MFFPVVFILAVGIFTGSAINETQPGFAKFTQEVIQVEKK